MTRLNQPDRVRAGDNIRYHTRMGHLTRPEACDKCGSTATKKPMAIPADWKKPLENITWVCTPCHKAILGRKPSAYTPRFQNIRKLPPYHELKRLVLPPRVGGAGLTYGEIAIRYDTARVVVHRTLRDRAMKRGEWPLPIDKSAKIIRGGQLEYQCIVAVGIMGLVDDYLEDRKYFVAGEDGVITPMRFTLKRWAQWHGFRPNYLSTLRQKGKMVRRDMAARLLEEIGEPVPKHLQPSTHK